MTALLGDSDQIHEALLRRNERTASRVRLRREGWTIDRLLRRVCELMDIRRARMAVGSRRRMYVRGRSLFLFLATTYLGCTRREAGRRVGVASSSAATGCVRGEAIAAEEKHRPARVFEAPWLDA